MDFEIYDKTKNFILEEIKSDYRREIPEDIFFNYSIFRYNFFNYIKASEFSNLRDYAIQVEQYLEETWPYCLKKDAIVDFDTAISFYIRSKGATGVQVETIINYLKNVEIKNIDKLNYENSYLNEVTVNYANIVGTSVDAYKADNLYDVMQKLADKSYPYIEYLILNNVFVDIKGFLEVFEGVCINCDEYGNLYVSEGNHRVFSYLILLKIRDYLGIDSPSKSFSFNQSVLFLDNKINKNRDF